MSCDKKKKKNTNNMSYVLDAGLNGPEHSNTVRRNIEKFKVVPSSIGMLDSETRVLTIMPCYSGI